MVSCDVVDQFRPQFEVLGHRREGAVRPHPAPAAALRTFQERTIQFNAREMTMRMEWRSGWMDGWMNERTNGEPLQPSHVRSPGYRRVVSKLLDCRSSAVHRVHHF